MITRNHLAAAFALTLACATFTGAAYGGNGNDGSAPGNSANAPGQQQKADVRSTSAVAAAAKPKPAAAAKPAQAAKAKGKPASAGKSAAKKPATASSKGVSARSTPAPQASAGKVTLCHKTGSASNPFVLITVSANAERAHRAHGDVTPTNGACPQGTQSADDETNANGHDKVLICHRTASETNPYVIINIARAGWENGHSGHDGDKLIRSAEPGEKPTADDLAFAAANCAAAGTSGVNATTIVKQGECPTTVTTTERVLIGFRHKTGNGSFVFVPANANSAHNDHTKHPDDEPVYDDVETTTVTGSEACDEQTLQSVQTVTTGGAAAGVATAGEQQAAGGVAGVEATIEQPTSQPAGGVLGAITEVGRGNLPFTGLPLWIALLVGLALVGAGYGVRKSTR